MCQPEDGVFPALDRGHEAHWPGVRPPLWGGPGAPSLTHSLTLFPQDLGAAAGSKRPTCVIMIKPHEEYQETYDECLEEVGALPLPL